MLMHHRRLGWLTLTALGLSIACVTALVAFKSLPGVRTLLTSPTSGYCAEMHDATGLYVGNNVTVHGVPVGKVQQIDTRDRTGVRVVFEISDGAPTIPADVRAVTRSNSILADRSLELSLPATGSRESLRPGTCVRRDRTYTPRSLTDLTDSTTRLVNAVVGTGQGQAISDLMTTLDSTLRGRADNLNDTLRTLDALTRNGDPVIGDLSRLLRDSAPLVRQMNGAWPTISQLLSNASGMLTAVPRTFDALSGFFDTSLIHLLQAVHDAYSRYGSYLSPILDTATAGIKLAATQAPLLRTAAALLPPLADLIASLGASANGLITFTAPGYRVRTPDATALCARINAAEPNSCRPVGNDHAEVSATGLLQSTFATGR